MGLDINAIRFLLAARASGASFEHTLTIGRQGLFVEPEALALLLPQDSGPSVQPQQLLREADGFAEPLLRRLGAQRVSSLDYSPYQGATIVHDMNEPIDDALKQQCSVVLDAGSLEHIFNFPQAIQNCMEMVALNGHFICITIANNYFGHGFYQFSPELFFRILSPENGFAVRRMVAYEEDWSDIRYYDVADPSRVGGRVTLTNRYPTALMVAAQRTGIVPVFARVPQQSDYVSTWQVFGPSERGAADGAVSRGRSKVDTLKDSLASLVGVMAPDWLKRRVRRFRHGPPAFNPSFFRETTL